MRFRLRHFPLPFAALAALLFAAACGTADLEKQLSSTYGPCVVGVENTTVVVAFSNSPFADRPQEERERTARKVAEYVRDHYAPYKGMTKVSVVFLSKKETAASSRGTTPVRYVYSHAELGPPRS